MIDRELEVGGRYQFEHVLWGRFRGVVREVGKENVLVQLEDLVQGVCRGPGEGLEMSRFLLTAAEVL